MIELGGLRDTYADAEEIRDDLLRLIYGLWDHTEEPLRARTGQAANHQLVWVSYVAGKRENRRLIGDYVLTQNDIRAADAVPRPGGLRRLGAWTTIIRPASSTTARSAKHYDDPARACQGLPFSIPFRCLYSQNVDNLLMAGRNISATPHGAVRHAGDADLRGDGPGGRARPPRCASQHGRRRAASCQQHLEELQQQLLKDGAYLIDLPNRDPRDLARRLAVSASSERTERDGEPMAAANAINGLARASGGKTNAWSPQPGSPTHWLELEWPQAQRFNMVHVSFAVRPCASAFAVEAWQDARGGGRRSVQLPATVLRTGFRLDHHRQTPLRLYRHDQRRGNSRLRRAAAAGRDRTPRAGGRLAAGSFSRPALVLQRQSAEAAWVGDRRQPSRADRRLGRVHVRRSRTSWTAICTTATKARARNRSVLCPKCPAGKYEIRMSYVPYKNRASNVPVAVATPTGATTIRVDQQRVPEIDRLFHSLGTFELPAGRGTSVVVETADTDGYVVVDALQLIER